MFDEPEIRPEVQAWLQERAAPRPGAAARYETLDGEQVALPPPGEAHSACVNRLARLLTEAVGDGGLVSVHSPIRLDEASEPCPDVALLEPRDDGYSSGFPEPTDVLLLVEVAASSFGLTHNRGRKAGHYARSGIPECWVVDLVSSQVLVHRDPASGGYRDIRNLRGDAVLRVQARPAVTFKVGDVLGEPAQQ